MQFLAQSNCACALDSSGRKIAAVFSGRWSRWRGGRLLEVEINASSARSQE